MQKRRVLLSAGIVLVAVLVAALGLVVWQDSRPGAPTLLGRATAVTFVAEPVPVAGAASIAGVVMPGPGTGTETLVFHGKPVVHFKVNTSAATARVVVCTRRGLPVGTGRATDLPRSCTRVRDIDRGVRMHWRGGRAMTEYLVLVVTPTTAGVATVDRITYDYERESGESGSDVGDLSYTVRSE